MRVLVALLVLVAGAFGQISLEVDRTINLQTQNARHESKLTVKNEGKEEVCRGLRFGLSSMII